MRLEPACLAPPLQPAVIRRSLEGMTASAQVCAGDFYGYLFASEPEFRWMFPPEMNNQNERLFSALLKIVGLLDEPDKLERYLTQLGADHRKYGVEPEFYAPVGSALIRTLRRHCPAWDDEAEAAWLAAYTVASETMIAGAECSDGPAYWRGRVIRHRRLTSDLAVISLQTDQPLLYEPGQYITVQHSKWPRVWRPFSVANAPVPGGDRIELHVRQVTGGWVSTALTRDTGVPDELIIGPAVGTMTADAANGSDLLLLAGGVGLAPLKALAESILDKDERMLVRGGSRRNICLYFGARTPLDLYAMPELRELERTYPWLQVVPVVSDVPAFSSLKGCVVDVALEQGWPGRHVYVAGPQGMIARAKDGLTAAGIPEDRVHYDEPATG